MRKGLLGCLLIGSLSIGADLRAKENAADGPRPIPTPEEYAAASQRFSQHIEKGLGIEFIGVTRNGTQVPGLFEIRSTGVSTRPVVDSAATFLASLSERQLEEPVFPVDDIEWRKWANQHIYHRAGVSLEALDDAQRKAAIDLLGASLSVRGLRLSRDIMRLNQTLGVE